MILASISNPIQSSRHPQPLDFSNTDPPNTMPFVNTTHQSHTPVSSVGHASTAMPPPLHTLSITFYRNHPIPTCSHHPKWVDRHGSNPWLCQVLQPAHVVWCGAFSSCLPSFVLQSACQPLFVWIFPVDHTWPSFAWPILSCKTQSIPVRCHTTHLLDAALKQPRQLSSQMHIFHWRWDRVVCGATTEARFHIGCVWDFCNRWRGGRFGGVRRRLCLGRRKMWQCVHGGDGSVAGWWDLVQAFFSVKFK